MGSKLRLHIIKKFELQVIDSPTQVKVYLESKFTTITVHKI